MSNANRPVTVKVKTDFAGAALIVGVFTLIVLFIGEPDLHDAWRSSLTPEQSPVGANVDEAMPAAYAKYDETGGAWKFYQPRPPAEATGD